MALVCICFTNRLEFTHSLIVEWGPVSAGTIMQGAILHTDGHIHEETEDARKYSSTP